MSPPYCPHTQMLRSLTGLPSANIRGFKLRNGAKPPNPTTNASRLYPCNLLWLSPRTTLSSSVIMKNKSSTSPMPPHCPFLPSAFAGGLRKTIKMVRLFLSFMTPHPPSFAPLPLPCGSSTAHVDFTGSQDFPSHFAKFLFDPPLFNISPLQRRLPSSASPPATPTTYPPSTPR